MNIIGLILMAAGACIGIYVGVWYCFIGGIVDIIESVRATDLSSMSVAIGFVKIMGSSIAGWVSAICLMIPGYKMLK